MSLALYRKYRPGSFAEVTGQDHVTGPLSRALANGRFSHAYLFSGPRGCGKTSSARIMARSLNCAEGPTPTPCGVCDSCVALAPNGPGSLDVIEIDAASHNGVDDARDLRERAFFAPVSSRFKVYIIDEAHMVTPAAFNALLKLVEEPPEFVKFIFATTEPDKVLQTIRSRTHHYPFRLIPPRDLTALLGRIVEAEGIPVDDSVLPLVVRAAAGSARDGLSILDQVLASSGPGGVTREVAAALLGVTPDALLDGLVDALAAHDARAVYALLDQVMEGGHDPRRFVTDVLERLRDLIILDAVPDAGASGLLDCPADQLERMGRQAVAMGPAGLSRAADLFHAGLTEMRGNAAPRLLLELLCARVLLPAAAGGDAALLDRLERLERRLEIAAAPAGPTGPPAPPPRRPVATKPSEAPGPAARESAAPADGGPAAALGDGARQGSARGDGARQGSAPADGRPGSARGDSEPPAAAQGDGQRPAAAWPTATRPGGRSADPAADRPATVPPPHERPQPPAPEAPAAIDSAALRAAWDQVLASVKSRKRTTNALLNDAQVVAVEGRTLVLAFQHAPILRQFTGSTGPDILKESLQEALGVALEIRCVPHGELGPHQAASSPSADHSAGHFAPGDEAVEEDPDAPAAAQPRGEDAAVRLVVDQLGGRVLSE